MFETTVNSVQFTIHLLISNCIRINTTYISLSTLNFLVSILNVFIVTYRIGGVLVNVLAQSAVDREFEPRSGQKKDYANVICYFSANYAALR